MTRAGVAADAERAHVQPEVAGRHGGDRLGHVSYPDYRVDEIHVVAVAKGAGNVQDRHIDDGQFLLEEIQHRTDRIDNLIDLFEHRPEEAVHKSAQVQLDGREIDRQRDGLTGLAESLVIRPVQAGNSTEAGEHITACNT